MSWRVNFLLHERQNVLYDVAKRCQINESPFQTSHLEWSRHWESLRCGNPNAIVECAEFNPLNSEALLIFGVRERVRGKEWVALVYLVRFLRNGRQILQQPASRKCILKIVFRIANAFCHEYFTSFSSEFHQINFHRENYIYILSILAFGAVLNTSFWDDTG